MSFLPQPVGLTAGGHLKTAQIEQRGNIMNESLLNTIIKVLIILESGGDPSAGGDGGKAVGILQIHPIMVRDVSRILGWDVETLDYKGKGEYTDNRLNPVFSVKVCKTYLRHYMQNIGDRNPDVFFVEYAARIWNGGPTGHKKTCTKWYSNRARRMFRIIQALDRIEKLGVLKGKQNGQRCQKMAILQWRES